MKLTSQQQKILDAPAGNILVSAAAGSGKTAVLTDRIVQRIARGDADVQQILVMTFTDSAAHEMKQRIETKLRDALSDSQEAPQRQYLSRQMSLLPGAAVSTIHAFCLRVIRDFIYLLRDDSDQPLLDASFSVDDGIEAGLILAESARTLLQELYEKIDDWHDAANSDSGPASEPDWISPFYRLTDSYGSSRSDQPLLDLLVQQYQYLRSLPDYQSFIDGRLQDLSGATENFSASRHASRIYEMLRLRLRRALSAVPRQRELLSGQVRFIRDPVRNHLFHDQFNHVFNCLETLADHLRLDQPDWDDIRRLAALLTGLDIPRANRADTSEKLEFMDLFIGQVAEVLYMLTGECGTKKFTDAFVFDTRPLFDSSSASIERDLRDMLPVINQFYRLLLDLDRHYAADKAAAGMIDFSDFEHFALQLLRLPEVSQYYRQRFKEIYIDEYQDTSSIQEAVLQAVSQNNCLMVGDLKQSIYRFRHARPQIFREKAQCFEQEQSGTLIELNRNFRSVNSILQAINDIFSQIMTAGTGDIVYDDRQALVPNREDEADGFRSARLLLLTSDDNSAVSGQEDPDDSGAADAGGESEGPTRQALDTLLSGYEREALLIVSRIRSQLMAGYALHDMAILCRTRRIVETTAARLREAGISVLEGHDANSFDIPELRLAEAFLRLLDNRCQDFPLASVMRSGLSGITFSDNNLASIRVYARSTEQAPVFYWQAVDLYAKSGSDDPLRDQVIQFLHWIDQWRDRAIDLRIDELLEDFYARSYWLSQLSLRPDGGERIRVLRQLQNLARQFERQQRRGVHQFVSYLDALREKEELGKVFDFQSLEQEGVRVMTIHGSKGLEFPVVFLIGTSYRLTPRESQAPLLMSESLGIGMDYIDPERQIKYASHLKLAMLEEVRAAGMAEELRLFYVALTRARDCLYVTASVASRQHERLLRLIQQARQVKSVRLPDYLVLSCQSVLQWMMLVLARDPEFSIAGLSSDGGEELLTSDTTGRQRPTAWQTEWIDWADLQVERNEFAPAGMAEGQPEIVQKETVEAGPQISGAETIRSESAADDHLLRQRVLGTYPYEAATRLPVKWAVSELKRREQQWEASDDSGGRDYLLRGDAATCHSLPDILDQRGINLTLQISDLAGDGTVKMRGAQQLGTLLHTVLRYLDLRHLRLDQTADAVDAELQRMKERSMLSADDLEALRPWHTAIRQFADSALAADMVEVMQSQTHEVYLEMPFTMAVPVRDIFPSADSELHDERVMIQGMIDCWYIKNDELILVDYKSDDIGGDDATCAAVLRRRYDVQLDWYARAIAAEQKRPVTHRLIWHIRRGRAFEI